VIPDVDFSIELLKRDPLSVKPRPLTEHDTRRNKRSSLDCTSSRNVNAFANDRVLDEAVLADNRALEDVRVVDARVGADVDVLAEDGVRDEGVGTDDGAVAEKGGGGDLAGPVKNR
jgi:hypothetical protein